MTRTSTMAKSRNIESRDLNNREQDMEFREPNMLDIPENVHNRFKNEGMALRWIRINLRGKDDYTNVGKRLQEGWQFVSVNEVPEIQHTSFVRDEGRYTGAVCRGDLALAKMQSGKSTNVREISCFVVMRCTSDDRFAWQRLAARPLDHASCVICPAAPPLRLRRCKGAVQCAAGKSWRGC